MSAIASIPLKLFVYLYCIRVKLSEKNQNQNQKQKSKVDVKKTGRSTRSRDERNTTHTESKPFDKFPIRMKKSESGNSLVKTDKLKRKDNTLSKIPGKNVTTTTAYTSHPYTSLVSMHNGQCSIQSYVNSRAFTSEC